MILLSELTVSDPSSVANWVFIRRSALLSLVVFMPTFTEKMPCALVSWTTLRTALWSTGAARRANGTKLFCRLVTAESYSHTIASSPVRWVIIPHNNGALTADLWRSFWLHTPTLTRKSRHIWPLVQKFSHGVYGFSKSSTLRYIRNYD